MLVNPHFSGDQVFLFTLRRDAQQIAGLTIQNYFANISEIVIVSAEGRSSLIVARRRVHLVVQDTSNNMLSPIAAR